jgi:hypothetical protein
MTMEDRIKRLIHNVLYHIAEEDLVPELRGLLNIFDRENGAANYREKISSAMEWAESDHPEARTFLLAELGSAAEIARDFARRKRP